MKDLSCTIAACVFAVAIWSAVIWVKATAWQECRQNNSFTFCFVAIGGR